MLVLIRVLAIVYSTTAALAIAPTITARWGRCGRGIDRCLAPIIRCHDHIFADVDAACGRIFQLYLAVLSLPMFVAGTWLGVLVIVGQGKKQGHLNFITALILLFDVGFKIGATIFCEVYDLWFVPWRQRRRQRAAEERRAQVRRRQGEGEEIERELAPALQDEAEQQLALAPPRLSSEEEAEQGSDQQPAATRLSAVQQPRQQGQATEGDPDALQHGSDSVSEDESESV